MYAVNIASPMVLVGAVVYFYIFLKGQGCDYAPSWIGLVISIFIAVKCDGSGV